MAARADSCMTSPSLPVIVSCPLPGITVTSVAKSSPPRSVQANRRVLHVTDFHGIGQLSFAWHNSHFGSKKFTAELGPSQSSRHSDLLFGVRFTISIFGGAQVLMQAFCAED